MSFMDGQELRAGITNAIRFWEPLRLVYNLVLAIIVAACFFKAYPSSMHELSFDGALLLFVLGVLANVAYCAVYIVDVFVQLSSLNQQWRRGRWVVFLVGLSFAAILTRFWSAGLFSLPR